MIQFGLGLLFLFLICFIWLRAYQYRRSFFKQSGIDVYRWTYRLFDYYKDLEYSIQTGGYIHPAELQGPGSLKVHAKAYQAAPYAVLFKVFESLNKYKKYREAFIDLGCGKGRALSFALESGIPFVKGIDISPELLKQASNNLKQTFNNLHPLHPELELECQSAHLTKFPSHPFTLFMFNPFDEKMLAATLENLDHQGCRDFILVYVNPVYADSIASHFDLKCIEESPHFYEDYSFKIFSPKELDKRSFIASEAIKNPKLPVTAAEVPRPAAQSSTPSGLTSGS